MVSSLVAKFPGGEVTRYPQQSFQMNSVQLVHVALRKLEHLFGFVPPCDFAQNLLSLCFRVCPLELE